MFGGLFGSRSHKRAASVATDHHVPELNDDSATNAPNESPTRSKFGRTTSKPHSPLARRRPSLFGFGFGGKEKKESHAQQQHQQQGQGQQNTGTSGDCELMTRSIEQLTEINSNLSNNSCAISSIEASLTAVQTSTTTIATASVVSSKPTNVSSPSNTPPRKQSKSSSIVSIGFLQQLHHSLIGNSHNLNNAANNSSSNNVAGGGATQSTTEDRNCSITPPKSPVLSKQRSPTSGRRNSKTLMSAFSFFSQADQQQKQYWFQSQRQSKRNSIPAKEGENDLHQNVNHSNVNAACQTDGSNGSSTNPLVPSMFSTINESFGESIQDSDREVSDFFANVTDLPLFKEQTHRPVSPMPTMNSNSSVNTTTGSNNLVNSDRNNNDVQSESLVSSNAANQSMHAIDCKANVMPATGSSSSTTAVVSTANVSSSVKGAGNRKVSLSVKGNELLTDSHEASVGKRKQMQVPSQSRRWEDSEGRAYEPVYGQVGGKSIGFEWEPCEETDAFDGSDFSMYENRSGLAEDMKFLASMPELCDITFLVGETREPVCAVRAVLASRSR